MLRSFSKNLSFSALLLFLLCGLQMWPGVTHAEDDYLMAIRDPQTDPSQNYLVQLLQAALEASKPQYGPYKLSTEILSMQRRRVLVELQSGQLVNVGIQLTSPDWEQALLPIRIPVDKGLTNFRIALIDGRRQEEFSHIKSLQQLRQLAVGVGEQWATRDLYYQNDLHVVTGNSNSGMAGMLMQGRFDYFPRSVEEAVRETKALSPSNPNLAMEKTFMIYLPVPRYFFISPHAPRLAERLKAGLEKLIASGDFDRAFRDYYGPAIVEAGLCGRTIFRLKNASLSPETPLERRNLWFDPFSGADRKLACGAADKPRKTP